MSEYPLAPRTISVPLEQWEAAQAKAEAAERLMRDLLLGVDDFERAIASAEREESYPAILKGLHAIRAALVQALGVQGVRRFDSVGQVFDPARHEPLVEEAADGSVAGPVVPPGSVVVEELRPGYERDGAIFRKAWVKVGPATRPRET